MAALNLGAAGSAPAVEAPDLTIHPWGWALAALPFLAAWVLSALVARAAARNGRAAASPVPALADWSPAAKTLVFLYLGATALTHLFAVGAIWQATRVAVNGNAEYFRFAKPLHLFRMSHQHAFGHGTMYLLVGALALATRAPVRAAAFGIGLTFLGALADLASWWLQKYGGPSFEPLSMGGGAAFAAGFALLALLILRDLLTARRA